MANMFSRVPGQRSGGRRLAWAILFLLTIAVLAIVLIPVFLIMPFSPQSPRSMEISFLLRRWSPSLTLAASVLVIALLIWLWRGTRWRSKPVLAIALLLTGGASWLARQNHFEWMFNPLPNPAYAKTNEASFVKDSDRVMAIEIGGEAVAYPIQLMAYHHLVQDTVGGTQVVATY